MGALELLVDLGISRLEVSKNPDGYTVCYQCAYVKDGVALIGVYGKGRTVEEAAKDYVGNICGKRVVVNPGSSAQEDYQVGGLPTWLVAKDLADQG